MANQTAGGDKLSHRAASQRIHYPWENSGLIASEMVSHSGQNGVSLGTPRMARSMARYLLTEWRAGADLIEVAELLASELATNAVRVSPPWMQVPCITVTFWYVPDLAVIEVSDKNEKPPELQVPDDESENGRGLQLVDALSREWSYYFPRKGWKTVYCVIGERRPRDASGSR